MLQQVTECNGIKYGDHLTIDNDIINISGHLLLGKDEKVMVENMDIVPGHWHSQLPDLWINPKISLIRISRMDGEPFGLVPSAFKELK